MRIKAASARNSAKIRAITLGLPDAPRPDSLRYSASKLQSIQSAFEESGFPVQTLRLALPGSDAIIREHPESYFAELNRACEELGIALLGLGGMHAPESVRLAAGLVRRFERLSACILIRSEADLPPDTLLAGARAIRALSAETSGGLGNFRFCAGFGIPPHVPFFPAAYSSGRCAFSVGLENAGYFNAMLRAAGPATDLFAAFAGAATEIYEAVQTICLEAEQNTGVEFAGIDTSIAPGVEPEGSARMLLNLLGAELGRPGAVAVCERITRALRAANVKQIGFRGLMLPLLEDHGLAELARENGVRSNDLLLCSAVCGVGLDMLPLPGDVDEATIVAMLRDVAAMAMRLNKPLMARLLPAPGKRAGETTTFDSPYLCNSAVMEV